MDARRVYEQEAYDRYYVEAVRVGSFTPFYDAHFRTIEHMKWSDKFYCYEHSCKRKWNGHVYACGECKAAWLVRINKS